MAIWEPLFVSVVGGRRDERKVLRGQLVTALRRRGIGAAALDTGPRTRDRCPRRPPQRFWENDVVLVEGFAGSGVPLIVLASRKPPALHRGHGEVLALVDEPAGSGRRGRLASPALLDRIVSEIARVRKRRSRRPPAAKTLPSGAERVRAK
jgi:hypothetical protein